MNVPVPSVLGIARLELTVSLGEIAVDDPDGALRELIAAAQQARRVLAALSAHGWSVQCEGERVLLVVQDVGEAEARAQVAAVGGPASAMTFSSAVAPDLAMFTDAGNRAVAAAADALADTYAVRLRTEADSAALTDHEAQLVIAAGLGFLAARERAEHAGLRAPGLEHLTGLLARSVIGALVELADVYPEAVDSEPREMALTRVALRLGLHGDDL